MAFIELKGRKHVISVLLDSGSNIFLMNQNTARPLEIPTEARDSRLKIITFDGETAPTGGIFSRILFSSKSVPTATEA